MVFFSSAKNAITASLEMKERCDRYNDRHKNPLKRIDFRVCMDSGVLSKSKTKFGVDYFGDAVNIASRLQGKTH